MELPQKPWRQGAAKHDTSAALWDGTACCWGWPAWTLPAMCRTRHADHKYPTGRTESVRPFGDCLPAPFMSPPREPACSKWHMIRFLSRFWDWEAPSRKSFRLVVGQWAIFASWVSYICFFTYTLIYMHILTYIHTYILIYMHKYTLTLKSTYLHSSL